MNFLSLLILTFICAFTSYATDDGLTTDVTWDQYSLLINGERVFIFSGEFHYERMPVPELWLDIFQKYKANGLNAVRYERRNLVTPRKIMLNFEQHLLLLVLSLCI